jgi:DNA-directed RNA polymerase subunit RPC12/RpoP
MDYTIIQNGFTRKDHYVCFDCRKSFKRPSFRFVPAQTLRSEDHHSFSRHILMRLNQSVVCPNCGHFSRFAGRDFKAPKMRDVKAWELVRSFLDSGRTYYCGTSTERDVLRDAKRNGFVTPSERKLTQRYWADYQKRKST